MSEKEGEAIEESAKLRCCCYRYCVWWCRSSLNTFYSIDQRLEEFDFSMPKGAIEWADVADAVAWETVGME